MIPPNRAYRPIMYSVLNRTGIQLQSGDKEYNKYTDLRKDRLRERFPYVLDWHGKSTRRWKCNSYYNSYNQNDHKMVGH